MVERLRQCCVSRQTFPERQLIRFAVAPDGQILPDLASRLPGRGCWVKAERVVLEQAIAKKLLIQAFKKALSSARKSSQPARICPSRLYLSAHLASDIEQGLENRLLANLGLARKAGTAIFGLSCICEQLRRADHGKISVVIVAVEGEGEGKGIGPSDGERRIRALIKAGEHEVDCKKLFTTVQMGKIFGRDAVAYVALRAGNGTDKWLTDLNKWEMLTGRKTGSQHANDPRA